MTTRHPSVTTDDSVPARGNSTPEFTIFVPTFNRAGLIRRALQSIEAQTVPDFEVVVVDDGSEDETPAIVREWQEKTEFPVYYQWQPNQGKHVAHNTALELARGRFFVNLDSDDCLDTEALANFREAWQSIPDAEKSDFAGVEGLCGLMESGEVAGDEFPRDPFDATFMEMRHSAGVQGDKKAAYRTEVLRQFPFPRFPGEHHIPPSLVWRRIAYYYRMRHFNKVVQWVEYQPGGISASRKRSKNPQGYRLAFLEILNKFPEFYSKKERVRLAQQYVRCSLLAGIGFSEQRKALSSRRLWLLGLPAGLVNWLRDSARLRSR